MEGGFGSMHAMSSALSQRLLGLVSTRTGLHIRRRDQQNFQAALAGRIQALKLAGPREYCLLLESGTALAEQEWPELASRLTNRESYFFRDQGQMSLLRNQILPELIERNRPRRSLRLWSAGCSTGEEPYSLAILLSQLLPPSEEWQVVILGTDLNPKALTEAKRGIYGAWSFRTLEPLLRERFFHPCGDGWEVVEPIRRLVSFSHSNLTHDPFPNPGAELHDMDLILCRNVFIYFVPEAIPPVVCKLANTLRQGGYLITGHAEIDATCSARLQERRFPESVVYQQVNQPTLATRPHRSPALCALPTTAKLLSPSGETAVGSNLDRLRFFGTQPAPARNRLLASSSPARDVAVELEAKTDSREPPAEDLTALYLLAQTYVGRGRPELAEAVCHQASVRDPVAAGPYQVLAALAEDRGDYEEAKGLLKKIIYLAPASAAAYLELAALYLREGERTRARTMWATAHELLLRLPAEANLTPWAGPPAGEWLRHVEAQLADAE